MSYSQAELEALLQNDEFVQWVLQPDAAGNSHWEAWMRGHANRPALIARCKRIVLDLQAAESTVPAERLAGEIWDDMQAELRPQMRFMRYVAAAAVLLLLAGSGWWWMNRAGQQETPLAAMPAIIREGNGEILAINNGKGLQTVLMTDGSRITLSPGAKVHYKSLPGPDARNVKLEGSAFFEVAPDEQRPFTVFAGKLVTRVLGTSFRISGQENITVAVRSGKVSVSHDGERKSWILLPNEQAVFDAGRNTIDKSVVIHKAILENPILPAPRFSFDETPAPAIVDALAATYSVDFRYDRRLFEKCKITVSLEEGTFYDKLDVLCKVLGATYEIVNNEVRIAGPGCQ